MSWQFFLKLLALRDTLNDTWSGLRTVVGVPLLRLISVTHVLLYDTKQWSFAGEVLNVTLEITKFWSYNFIHCDNNSGFFFYHHVSNCTLTHLLPRVFTYTRALLWYEA